MQCVSCGTAFPETPWGGIDLRLQKPKQVAVEFTLGPPLPIQSKDLFEILEMNPTPEVDFSDRRVPYHFTREFLSYFPRARTDGALMLDLGCGNGRHKSMCERAGFGWVGLDAGEDEKPPILGDGHALPFADASFDFVMSMNVLEHLRYPHVALHEVGRVLKPGGRFIGTVAFLEPFHGNSYYHFTHFGVLSALLNGGFKVLRVAPNVNWPGLVAIGEMALFPKLPTSLTRLVFLPAMILQKIMWWLRGFVKKDDAESALVRRTVGSFAFIATR
jgi:SAM-dependent methyltransferase